MVRTTEQVRRFAMNRLKQGTAAVTLVASLGLLAPSSLGGPALADIKPPPNDHVRNPQYVEDIYHCDLNGDGDYETKYELVSTFGSAMWQVKNSNTVLVLVSFDLQSSTYEVVHDPTGTAVNFVDPIGYWSPEPEGPGQPNGQHKGQRRVLCENTTEYNFAPFDSDVEQGEDLVDDGIWDANFVQTEECPDDPDSIAVPREEYKVDGEFVCVTYHETDNYLVEVTISRAPGGTKQSGSSGVVQAANVDDGKQSADLLNKSKHKAKKGGKHRGKGKRGR
jgi:hypothetical protein